ncbi:hypothetical protein COLO4_35480 [Corchorus olitorius]|uniref:Uncharacterized protein n=1 Tax=Corchorus olitorius TaxID=93759 RepID=A0A1R3GGM6_9ROSI|nr:hypothetical protein COLO4_35480 [Corchorus olitorius]
MGFFSKNGLNPSRRLLKSLPPLLHEFIVGVQPTTSVGACFPEMKPLMTSLGPKLDAFPT